MSSHISETLFSQLTELVANRMGLSFPGERRRDLEHGTHSAAREFGHDDVEICIRWLLSSQLTRTKIETLASYLTVGETYFFRESKTFEALEQSIFPELIRQRGGEDRHLRIWSAGCASGEEPYSIAILLSRMLPDLKNWNITILATDVDHRALNKAARGIYSHWSFRDCPGWVKKEYFKRTEDGNFEIRPDIKRMVTFGYHNLAEDTYPSLLSNTNAMDIIFCRNVLMYFVPERQAAVIQNFYHCLTDGGWLIVSPSESSHVLYPQFVPVSLADGSAPFYTKDHQPEARRDSLLAKELVLSHLELSKPAKAVAQEEGKTAVSETIRLKEVQASCEQKRYVEAEKAVAGFLSQNQTDPEAMALLARICANQGRLSEAISWCQKAVSVDKLNPSYHYLLAAVLQEKGQTEEAVSSLKHALFLDPGFALAHVALGNLTLHQGKSKQSRKHFANALSLLNKYRPENALPQADGMTVARLIEVIKSQACLGKLP